MRRRRPALEFRGVQPRLDHAVIHVSGWAPSCPSGPGNADLCGRPVEFISYG